MSYTDPPHSNQDVNIVFLAKSDNPQDISKLLSTLIKTDSETTKKGSTHTQFITCSISPTTMTFTFEEGKHYQASCALKANFFEDYRCLLPVPPTDEELRDVAVPSAYTFKVNLLMIIDGLNIFGSNTDSVPSTSVQFVYGGYGKPFILMLTETTSNNVNATFSIKTQEADDISQFDLMTPITNKIMINSESILEAFGELDYSSSNVTITLSPEQPYFKLSTKGNMGAFEMEFNQSLGADKLFEFYELHQNISHVFQLPQIKPCIKSLAQGSTKTKLSLSSTGILQLQNILTIGSAHYPVTFTVVAISPVYQDDNMHLD